MDQHRDKLTVGGNASCFPFSALTEGLEETTRTPAQLTAESNKRQAEATLAEAESVLVAAPDVEKNALREKIAELEQQLAKAQQEADRFEVRDLYVLDHPPLLDDALSKATSRLMIISPWIAGKVVNRDFTNKLEVCGAFTFPSCPVKTSPKADFGTVSSELA